MGSGARTPKTRGMPPPDENTTVDPTGAAWVVWLVIVGPGLLFVTFACVRRVGAGELVLVVRHGRVVRASEGGFIAQPLAVVVIGGLISSTVLTLLLVPTLYAMLELRKERRAEKKAAKRAAKQDNGDGPDTATPPSSADEPETAQV